MEKQDIKRDKLTDKAFTRLIITSVLGILVCIVCLCSATWAWFSAAVSADGNKVRAGKFDLTVSVADQSDSQLQITENADGKRVCTFEDAGTYTVSLKMTDDTTVTKGFCIIYVGEDTYYTASINAETDPFTFTLDVKEAGASVIFSPAWGSPSELDLVDMDEVLTIGESDAIEEQESALEQENE